MEVRDNFERVIENAGSGGAAMSLVMSTLSV